MQECLIKTSTPSQEIPLDLANADAQLKDIADALNQISKIRAELNMTIREATNRSEKLIAEHEEVIGKKFKGIETFMNVNRERIMQKVRSISVSNGKLGWSKSLSIRADDEQAAIAELERKMKKVKGLKDSVRIVKEINRAELRNLLRKKPDILKGFKTIYRHVKEAFWIKPAGTDCRIVADEGDMIKIVFSKQK